MKEKIMPDLFFDTFSSEQNLKGIRFALIGKLLQSKDKYSKLIEQKGGDRNTSLSKDSCVVVIGSNPTPKDINKLNILKHDGFNIPQIAEAEFIDILEGRNKTFNYPKVIKQVNIDYDFIFNPQYKCLVSISKDGITHCIGSREIFVYNDTPNIHLLHQIIGNLAGETRNAFYPYETDYILLWDSSLKLLKEGKKDNLIKIIENGYNNSKAEKFNYKFILARDLMSFAKNRSIKIKDDITLELIEKYERG